MRLSRFSMPVIAVTALMLSGFLPNAEKQPKPKPTPTPTDPCPGPGCPDVPTTTTKKKTTHHRKHHKKTTKIPTPTPA